MIIEFRKLKHKFKATLDSTSSRLPWTPYQERVSERQNKEQNKIETEKGGQEVERDQEG